MTREYADHIYKDYHTSVEKNLDMVKFPRCNPLNQELSETNMGTQKFK